MQFNAKFDVVKRPESDRTCNVLLLCSGTRSVCRRACRARHRTPIVSKDPDANKLTHVVNSEMPIEIRAALPSEASSIAAIYNQGIEERAATFETTPRRVEDMLERIKAAERFPVLVAVDPNGSVLGWAGLSPYRARACYAGIAEFSVYLDSKARGRGAGKQLLNELVATAAKLGYWKLLSRAFPFNTASRALCRACGFREVGTYEKHAKLGDAWLDVVIVERLIPANLS
jgi:L-amino acid N-acyltransferase YncA